MRNFPRFLFVRILFHQLFRVFDHGRKRHVFIYVTCYHNLVKKSLSPTFLSHFVHKHTHAQTKILGKFISPTCRMNGFVQTFFKWTEQVSFLCRLIYCLSIPFIYYEQIIQLHVYRLLCLCFGNFDYPHLQINDQSHIIYNKILVWFGLCIFVSASMPLNKVDMFLVQLRKVANTKNTLNVLTMRFPYTSTITQSVCVRQSAKNWGVKRNFEKMSKRNWLSEEQQRNKCARIACLKNRIEEIMISKRKVALFLFRCKQFCRRMVLLIYSRTTAFVYNVCWLLSCTNIKATQNGQEAEIFPTTDSKHTI